jgi:murein DD-endopeptidase MepM/ murein hydrolase activator NlpD
MVAGLGATAAMFSLRYYETKELLRTERRAIEDSRAAALITESHKDVISEAQVRPGSNLTDVLRSSGVDQESADQITNVVRPVWNPRKLRAGDKLLFVHRYYGPLKEIHYRTGFDTELAIEKTPAGFKASEKKLTSQITTEVVQATLQSSLFESVLDAGEHPELAVRLAEIFAFDLDFYTDPQPGDTFRLVFEKRVVPGGEAPSYGRIFAAEYVNHGKTYDAVLFRDPSGRPAYYTADGKSLQKAFLKSPLKFAARVSSHFNRHRYHPVLKVYRAHMGTDYAAPIGTPVQAIANGKVEFSARKGGNGNLVIIRHFNGYESYYLHLSRLLVRKGQSVQQGQRIGLVGMTGLASGPHLDFRLRRNGSFVDWERIKLPPSNPVSSKDQPAFYVERDKWIGMLREAKAPSTKVAVSDTSDKVPAAD